MTSERTENKREHHYVCGQCGNEQYAIIGQEPPVPCVDCGWAHRDLKKYDLPSEIKLDLKKYN